MEQNETFNLAYRFITETQESIFLTGKAGTGKTTFLKHLKNNSAKNIVVAAPTGVAAINAGGVTLHSLFQLPFHPYLPTEGNKTKLLQERRYNKRRIQLLRKIELLVIDEISMVRCDVIDAIDAILKSVRRKHDVAFGGVQVVFIGDLFQLPPVAKREEWQLLQEYYSSPFFFDSKAVKDLQPLMIEFTHIYRQKEDLFVNLLNKVRNNQMEEDDFNMLNERYVQQFQPNEDEKFITLTSHNNQANNINQQKIQSLLAPAYSYKAEVENDFPEWNYPADETLILKEGAQVMFIKNDVVEKKYFNGKIGTVQKLTTDNITVNCDGEIITVKKDVWENSTYNINKATEQLEQKIIGTFSQYPLRLAWAITIHKSQGLTFNKLMIDAAAAFSSGQVYVALSRCTSLQGIVLLSKIPASAIYSNQQVVQAQHSMSPRGSLAERFTEARQLFTLQLFDEIFSLQEIDTSIFRLTKAITNHTEKINNDAAQWLQNFTEAFTKEKTVAQKFIFKLHEMLQTEPVIESNSTAQKRIQDAAGYFLPHLENLKKQLQQNPIVTEHKDAAEDIDEYLAELLAIITTNIYLMQYCKQPFMVADYLKHKLNFAMPRLQISSYALNKKQKYDTAITNAELYLKLKLWRDEICTDEQLPIFLVAANNSLKEISTYLPLNKKDLQQLSGFGKAKADKYGDDIIELVNDYCDKNNLTTNIAAKADNPKKQRKELSDSKETKTPSSVISLQMYQSGKSIADISKERNFAISTIEGHLTQHIKTGELSVSVFVNEASLNIVKELLQTHPDKQHSEIRALSNNEYSFTQIRAVANHLIWENENKS